MGKEDNTDHLTYSPFFRHQSPHMTPFFFLHWVKPLQIGRGGILWMGLFHTHIYSSFIGGWHVGLHFPWESQPSIGTVFPTICLKLGKIPWWTADCVAAHVCVQNISSTCVTKTVLKHEGFFFKAIYYLLDEWQRTWKITCPVMTVLCQQYSPGSFRNESLLLQRARH